MLVVGWIITALPALALLMSGGMKFAGVKPPEGSPDVGWKESSVFGLAFVEIGCVIVYLIPRTAVFGAVLLTGYLGGAIATHVRIGDQFVPQLIIGTLVWLGLFFRDERLRVLLPWRTNPCVPATGGFMAGLGVTLLTLLLLVLLVIALSAAHPAEIYVTRSVTIDAPPARIFDHVNDFHKWEAWSPWHKLDPHAKYTYEGPSAGAGAVVKWVGNDHVGEGSMTILESVPNERIKIKLQFFKPFEDTSETMFIFQAKEDKTEVIWSMTGERNLLFKAMCVAMNMNMEKMVGDSYAEGLANIKAVAEGKAKK
jgi:uncharacterized protein YndB with AHSA1/START domain